MRDRRAIALFFLTIAVAAGLVFIALALFVAVIPRNTAISVLERLDDVGQQIPLFRSILTREVDERADLALATAITLIALVSGLSLLARYRRMLLVSLNTAVARVSPPLGRLWRPAPVRPPRDATVADVLALSYEQRSVRACFILLAALVVSLLLWRFAPESTPAGIATPIAVCVFYLAVYLRQGLLHRRVRNGWFANNPHEARQFLEFILAHQGDGDITRGGMRRPLADATLPAPSLDGRAVDA